MRDKLTAPPAICFGEINLIYYNYFRQHVFCHIFNYFTSQIKKVSIMWTVIHNLWSIFNTHLNNDNSQYIVMATMLFILTAASPPTKVPQ